MSEQYWKARAERLEAAEKDEAAVDRFAQAMKEKLAQARAKGRSGWDDPEACTPEDLAGMLVDHLYKGNVGSFEDVANFCMMLHQRGESCLHLPQALRESAEAADNHLQGEADEALSIVEHQLYRDAAQGYMTDERVPSAFTQIRNALASRQQCPYVVTSRGGTSHCSLAEQWSIQRVPDEIRRLPDELRIMASRSQDGVREGIEEAADELERTIAESGDDHERNDKGRTTSHFRGT